MQKSVSLNVKNFISIVLHSNELLINKIIQTPIDLSTRPTPIRKNHSIALLELMMPSIEINVKYYNRT